MCLIVVQRPEALPIDKEEFEEVWQGNHDGGGIMFTARGKLHIWKPYWKLRHFWKGYLEAMRRADGPIVLHWRYATHGAINRENTHPHELAGGAAGLVHNGILPCQAEEGRSDTMIWCHKVFSGLGARELVSKELREILEPHIGTNKIAILNAAGGLSIFNEGYGDWEDGRWYSNMWHRPSIGFGRREWWDGGVMGAVDRDLERRWETLAVWERWEK